MHVHEYVCICVPICESVESVPTCVWRTEVHPVHSSLLLTPCFLTRVCSLNLMLTNPAGLARKSLLIPRSPAVESRQATTVPGFHIGAGDTNSASHACMTTLYTHHHLPTQELFKLWKTSSGLCFTWLCPRGVSA